MMKTALSIVQNTRYRMNLTAPTTLVSVTDPDERQLVALFYAVCEDLRQARCWPQLKRSYTFTTSASRTRYYLPPDFYAPLLKTHWNESEDEKLIGPASDADFTNLLYSGSGSTVNFTWRVFGMDENTAGSNGQFEINPTPAPELYATSTAYAVGESVTTSGGNIYICTTAIANSTTSPTGTGTSNDDTGVWTYVSAWTGETLSFEYISRSFLLPRNWAASAVFAAGSYCNANGRIYYSSAGGTSGSTIPSHSTGSASDGSVSWAVYTSAYETVVADTDLCVFDDDLVKLGLRAFMIREDNGDYQAALDEYEAKKNQAVARWRGSYVGTMGRVKTGPRYTVPFKGWSL